jgi:hypothetical protein
MLLSMESRLLINSDFLNFLLNKIRKSLKIHFSVKYDPITMRLELFESLKHAVEYEKPFVDKIRFSNFLLNKIRKSLKIHFSVKYDPITMRLELFKSHRHASEYGKPIVKNF